MRIILSPQAAADLVRLHAFLLEKSPSAARRASETLEAAIQSLDHFPDRGRPSPVLGLRELVVPFGRSAYIVRYAHIVDAEEIIIVRIWHGREKRD